MKNGKDKELRRAEIKYGFKTTAVYPLVMEFTKSVVIVVSNNMEANLRDTIGRSLIDYSVKLVPLLSAIYNATEKEYAFKAFLDVAHLLDSLLTIAISSSKGARRFLHAKVTVLEDIINQVKNWKNATIKRNSRTV